MGPFRRDKMFSKLSEFHPMYNTSRLNLPKSPAPQPSSTRFLVKICADISNTTPKKAAAITHTTFFILTGRTMTRNAIIRIIIRLLMEISVKQMYDIENAGHAMGFHKILMMENAGAAATQRLLDHTDDISSKTVLVIAGMGNNGGDGLVMARHLAGYGADVTIIMMGKPSDIKTVECRQNYNILTKMPSITISDKIDTTQYDIILDAMLGTGIIGDIREPYSSAIQYVNDSESFVLAVDVPSGLNPDTGKTANVFIRADVTVTFHKMKRGIPKRPDITGTTYAERIGIPVEAEGDIIQ